MISAPNLIYLMDLGLQSRESATPAVVTLPLHSEHDKNDPDKEID